MRGDAAAFDQLFEGMRPSLVRCARAVVIDAQEAEDVVQMAFLKVWRALASFDPSRPFGPWARTIVRRTAIDRARSVGRQGRAQQRFESTARVRQDSPEELVCRSESRGRVWAAVAGLPSSEQVVVRLVYLEGLTQREAADRLGLPLGTVKSRSSRAMGRLRSSLWMEGSSAMVASGTGA